MNSESEILLQLQQISETLSRLVALIEDGKQSKPRAERKPQIKQAPATQEEITAHKKTFDLLYERWKDGDDLSVQNELEMMTPEELRRFADANDLNVTSKLSKEKTLALIAGRFREKKQLFMPLVSRS